MDSIYLTNILLSRTDSLTNIPLPAHERPHIPHLLHIPHLHLQPWQKWLTYGVLLTLAMTLLAIIIGISRKKAQKKKAAARSTNEVERGVEVWYGQTAGRSAVDITRETPVREEGEAERAREVALRRKLDLERGEDERWAAAYLRGERG